MMDLRDMELLSALARHSHFARASEECGISQPAFSARIRNLETALGAALVKRGNRFLGFTLEGDIAVKWARQMLADVDALRQEIRAGELSGRFTLGCIPTALAQAAQVQPVLQKLHPNLHLEIISTSASQIFRGLENFSFNAGLTYINQIESKGFVADKLYTERYVLFCPPALAPKAHVRSKSHPKLHLEKTPNSGNYEELSWAEAATLPLCMLTRNMQNREILNEAFHRAGAVPQPVMETNAMTVAIAQVINGSAATIAPESLVDGVFNLGDIRSYHLIEPEVEMPVGFVRLDRHPPSPTLAALLEALKCAVNL